jgi:hypothetical protein
MRWPMGGAVHLKLTYYRAAVPARREQTRKIIPKEQSLQQYAAMDIMPV